MDGRPTTRFLDLKNVDLRNQNVHPMSTIVR